MIGGDDEADVGTEEVPEEMLKDDEGGVTGSLGEDELCGLPLLLHATVSAATDSTAAMKPL